MLVAAFSGPGSSAETMENGEWKGKSSIYFSLFWTKKLFQVLLKTYEAFGFELIITCVDTHSLFPPLHPLASFGDKFANWKALCSKILSKVIMSNISSVMMYHLVTCFKSPPFPKHQLLTMVREFLLSGISCFSYLVLESGCISHTLLQERKTKLSCAKQKDNLLE